MKRSNTDDLVTLRSQLQAKYPSMSDAALKSAMEAAASTMEGRMPRTTVTTSRMTRKANKARARDARKKNR